MDPGELAPRLGLDSGLLAQLAARPVERALAVGHAALGDLPRVGVEHVPMLADEQHAVALVDGEDPGRQVREVDHAVDPGAAVGPGHLVVPDRDPGVVIADPARATDPRAADDRCLIHRAIVARRGRARPARRAARRLAADGRHADQTHGRPASEPRHEVETVWDARIPARDGVELSANLWLPRPAAGTPERFPAVLEMIPYGKDSWRRNADIARGTYLARRGYVLCRVDVRGTGSSGGIALDEYTEAETLDGYDAVEWLAAQPWCDGAVGMWGISYGGFTSIQVAKLRPPHLRAIVPIQATDDRYLSDVHYIGGCLTASELSQYAVSQVGMNAMPPDPAFWGDDWRARWLARLEATPPWLFAWLREQHDGPYWRQGSLAPDYDAIEAAVLHFGGWMDSYVDAALRMQARCTAPIRTVVGSWVHGLPSSATPGPNVDELHELVRFFDRWLKGIPNGVDTEPAIVWFERDYAEPEPFPEVLPGRWRAAGAYPHPSARAREWRFSGGPLPLVGELEADEAAVVDGIDRYRHQPTVGTRAALSWGAGGPPNGLGRDLRPDEAFGPTYTTAPLETTRSRSSACPRSSSTSPPRLPWPARSSA